MVSGKSILHLIPPTYLIASYQFDDGVLQSVCDWSTQNFDAVEIARVEYDRSQKEEI
jgi:hypothetical protein